jgi:hypothetical protein
LQIVLGPSEELSASFFPAVYKKNVQRRYAEISSQPSTDIY